MAKADIGIVGMSTMGSNLALNVERNGYVVAVFNRTAQRTKQFVDTRARDKNIMPAYSLEGFVELLKVPKRILLMVKAGKPVDDFIQKLVPLLGKGSIIIDGGNSHYMDTERRCKLLEDKGIRFLGAGISGGEKGALYGPSIMVGGSHEAYDEIAELLNVISARTEDGSCCAYLGKGGAGHFVKMTHNGIEYAIMQIISEAYDLLRTVADIEISEIQQIFEQWNEGRLNSFLMEITAKLLRKIDDETGKPLVELILDKAGSKGTGKWTVQSALDLGVAVPSIAASVNARILSDYKEQRVKLVKRYGEFLRKVGVDRYIFRNVLEEAVYVAALVAYAQGLHLISVASVDF
ncbi:MAG: NADP-dependent phosphogluconate dehydrogenase, partial [Synergistetes bacterium]|nr:NADP-dependent phosphogluconate dehydrogenase [Synergistota bacterium]